jgi:NTE family protein
MASCSAQMSDFDSSLARDGSGRNGASPVRTGSAALLSGADIWSSAPAPARLAERIAERAPPGIAAEKAAARVTVPGAPPRSELAAEIKRERASEGHAGRRGLAVDPAAVQPPGWPPRQMSLALQGGGSFGAFSWGVLDRLLEESECGFDSISGASVGAVNAALLASGLAEGGRDGARRRLSRFWTRLTHEASFRSLMLIGGFSPAGSSVAFGPALRARQFDPFDLDPLREALTREIDFAALRAAACPKLLVAATRVRDGGLQIFRNREITADVLLASSCPPLVHCAIEIDGEAYWDGGYSANPPLLALAQQSDADLLLVRITPTRDGFVPMTMAAIDRRLDQIMANATLNAELAALELARSGAPARAPRLFSIAAEDEFEALAQRSPADLGRGFITSLHRSGYAAADRWARQDPDGKLPATPGASETSGARAAIVSGTARHRAVHHYV